MIETLLFIAVYIVDWILELSGIGGYLLILFPALLYFTRGPSTSKLLILTLISGLFAEMMHGYYAGSLLLGMGVGVFVFQWTSRVIDWRAFHVQLLGMFVYLVLICFLRSTVIFLSGTRFVFPSLLSLFVSYCLAAGLLRYMDFKEARTKF